MELAFLLGLISISVPILVWAIRNLWIHFTGELPGKANTRRIAIVLGIAVFLSFAIPGGFMTRDGFDEVVKIADSINVNPDVVGGIYELFKLAMAAFAPMGAHAAGRSLRKE